MKTAFLRISCFFLCFFGTSVALADGITSVAPGRCCDSFKHYSGKPVSFEWVIFQNGIQQEKVEKETFSYRFAKEGNMISFFSAHDAAGETESSTFRVLVNANPNQLLPLNAVLRTLPPTDEAGIIHIPKNIPSFWMIAEESAGDIVEYRFDKNLVVDSDGDGDPANDQDNQTQHNLCGELIILKELPAIFLFVFCGERYRRSLYSESNRAHRRYGA